MLKNVRIDPKTGELNYYYPMEIVDPNDKIYAKINGFEVGMARLGFRSFEAIFIPCLRRKGEYYGKETFLSTPSEEQCLIYKNLCKEELGEQECIKQDGRCNIPNGRGGTKRCPLRIANPDYVPGGDAPKTLAVKCEGCKYEPFKHTHTVVEVSSLEDENEEGDTTAYEIPSPRGYYAGDRYEESKAQYVDYVGRHDPELATLADLRTDGYTQSEAARELKRPTSTVESQNDKLKKLLTDFLDDLISP